MPAYPPQAQSPARAMAPRRFSPKKRAPGQGGPMRVTRGNLESEETLEAGGQVRV